MICFALGVSLCLQAEGHYSSTHGGYSNVALGYGSVIAGGHQNTVGVAADLSASDADEASGAFGFVGAGWGNGVSVVTTTYCNHGFFCVLSRLFFFIFETSTCSGFIVVVVVVVF